MYTPVKGPYSLEFKKIVDRMLDSNPVNRPSADELWTEVLPSVSITSLVRILFPTTIEPYTHIEHVLFILWHINFLVVALYAPIRN